MEHDLTTTEGMEGAILSIRQEERKRFIELMGEFIGHYNACNSSLDTALFVMSHTEEK